MMSSYFHVAPTCISLLGCITVMANPSVHGAVAKIDSAFHKKIDNAPAGSTWNIIVIFKKDQNLHTAVQASVSSIKEPHLKAYEILMKLEKAANESQRRVVESITNFQRGRQSSTGKVLFKQLWDQNDLSISSASKELIYLLGDNNKPENANITNIVESEPFYVNTGERLTETDVPPPTMSTKPRTPPGSKEWIKEAWGLETINAPAWWNANYNGTGVIIGQIATGVDVRHPSLKWNWLGGRSGWLDSESNSNKFPYEAQPWDPHGTHAMGVMVGRGRGSSSEEESDVPFFGVGVAPGARWISCLGCRTTGIFQVVLCLVDYIRFCMMFMHCPNKLNQCLYRPDVVSLTIGCVQTEDQPCTYSQYPSPPPYDKTFDEMINIWKSTGIIPVFSSGNNGRRGCVTIDDPMEHENGITVGYVDRNDLLNINSSKGPPRIRYNSSEITARQIFKPNLVAPGTFVFSTVYTGTAEKFQYGYQTGSHAAASHVSGAIALLLSRTEKLTFEQIKQILQNFTQPNDKLKTSFPEEKCDGLNDSTVPNYKFGYGRLLLPDPNDKNLPAPRAPTREMPPPPDYTDLGSSSTKMHATKMELVLTAFIILCKYAMDEMEGFSFLF